MTCHRAIVSSTRKPEVHNLSDDDPATAMGNMHTNFVKFGRVVFDLFEQTDRQTDKRTHHNTSHNNDDRRIPQMMLVLHSPLK